MKISLLFCLISVGVLAGCVVLILIQYKRLKMQNSSLQESLKNVEQLNYELRAARHDYLNHLQVVYGLLELKEYAELEEYVKPVYKEIMKTGKALKTTKPALNALLRAKMAEAEEKQTDVYVEVKSDLKNLEVEDWQLCKVLANLIDNGMTALAEKTGERRLEIDVNESREQYIFTIANNGPAIPKENLEHIFKKGFTTKKEDGHGLGLAIVLDILKENNGSIDVKSDEMQTTFSVRFRKGEM